MLFRMFDLDADGVLNKREFKRYLTCTGIWGSQAAYANDRAFDDAWPLQCSTLGGDPEEGIRQSEFEGALYGKARRGLLDRDIDAAKLAAAKSGDEQDDGQMSILAEEKRLKAEKQGAAIAAEMERRAHAIRVRSAFPSWPGDPLRQLQKNEATRQRAKCRSTVIALRKTADRQRSRGSWSTPFSHAVYARTVLRGHKHNARIRTSVRDDVVTPTVRRRRRQSEGHTGRQASARHRALAELAASSARARAL